METDNLTRSRRRQRRGLQMALMSASAPGSAVAAAAAATSGEADSNIIDVSRALPINYPLISSGLLV